MKKTRSNAKWTGLTAAQRKTLESWLFEEQINYEQAWRMAREELGFKGSVSSLKRFYLRRYQERMLESMAEDKEDAQEIAEDAASTALFRTAGMKLAARAFFHHVRQAPGNVKEWSPLAKLMLSSENIELRHTFKAEENQLRRERLEFAKEKFQFDIVEKALKMLPELQELAEARNLPEYNKYEENKRINAITRSLFGSRRPKMHPENPEEEAAMEEQKRRRQSEEEVESRRMRQGVTRLTNVTALQRQERPANPAPNTGLGTQEIRKEGKLEGSVESASREQEGKTLNTEHRTLDIEGGRTCMTDEEWARRNKAA